MTNLSTIQIYRQSKYHLPLNQFDTNSTDVLSDAVGRYVGIRHRRVFASSPGGFLQLHDPIRQVLHRRASRVLLEKMHQLLDADTLPYLCQQLRFERSSGKPIEPLMDAVWARMLPVVPPTADVRPPSAQWDLSMR